jgi:hypothetical protein
MTMLRWPSLSVVYSRRSKRSSLAGSGPAHAQRDGATASDHKFLGAEVSLTRVIDESIPVLGVALDHVETFSMHSEKGDEMKRIHGEIPRSAWEKSLEGLTAEHAGDLANIELAELDLDGQSETKQIPFSYIEYDPHDDAVSVGVGGLDGRYPVMLRHVVEHPENVIVHSEVGSVTVEVRSFDASVTLITPSSRVGLPA